MMTVTYLSPRRVWRHTCSSTPMTVTPSKRPGSSISRRRPSASTALLAVFHDTANDSATRATLVLAHNGFQRPPQPTPRQLGTRLSRATQVLAPHVRTAPAPVTADRDQQRGRTPPEGSWASWRVTLSRALPCSPQRRRHESSLVIRHANTARSACTRCPVTSTRAHQAAESSEVRAARSRPQGSVRRRGLPDKACRNPHPRETSTLTRQRRADQPYTLNCEEPGNMPIARP